MRSQVTCNLALCGADYQRVKFKHRMEETEEWKFDDFKNNSEHLVKYQKWYIDYLVKEFGAKREDLILHKVTKGSNQMWVSVNHDNFLIKSSAFTKTQDIKVIPFFESFNLSPEDFDAKGNYDFPANNQTSDQSRAGIPYFQPVHGKRFGFRISKKYDGGNNDWLSMNGVAGEWAVAFHGIRCPNSIVAQTGKTVLESVMSGR